MKLLAKVVIFLFVCLSPLAAFSQTHTFPATDTANIFTGPNTFQGNLFTRLVQYTIATLPSPATTLLGELIVVTDGASGSDCAIGNGLTLVICANTGSAWVSVGGSSSLTDNIWAASQRFKGPIPYIDFTSLMPAGGCAADYNYTGVTGTISANSTALALSGGYYVNLKNGCGVLVPRAGATSSLSTPATPTASSYYATGSSTIKYAVVAFDNDEGVSAASPVYSFTTSQAYGSLTYWDFNYVTTSTVSNAVGYCLYSDKGAGGTFASVATAIACDAVPDFEDRGYTTPVPSFLPTHPPAAAQPKGLFARIVSGGGTANIVLDTNASTTATSQTVFHDESSFLLDAYNSPNQILGHAKTIIPAGVYFFGHWPNVNGLAIQQVGDIVLDDMPLTGPGFSAIDIDGSWGAQNVAHGQMKWTSTGIYGNANIPWIIGPGQTEHIRNISLFTVYGDGLLTGPTAGNASAHFFSSDAVAGTHGCGIKILNQSINVDVDNFYILGSDLQNACGGISFSNIVPGYGSAYVNFSNGWMENHSFTEEAPGLPNNPIVNANFFNIVTEAQWEHGIIDENDNQLAFSGPQFKGMDIDTNRFISTYYSLNYCVQAFQGCAQATFADGSTPPLASSIPNPIGSSSLSVSSNGPYNTSTLVWQVGIHPNGGDSVIGGVSSLIGGPLGLMSGRDRADFLGVLYTPPMIGTITPAGGGSLSAGTYYYRVTALDATGGETAASPEFHATVGASGTVSVVINDYLLGSAAGRYRMYRGATSGGEAGYLSASLAFAGTFVDTGAALTGSAAPPDNGNAYVSKLGYGGGQTSFLLAGPGTTGMENAILGIGLTSCSAGDKVCIGGGVFETTTGIGQTINLQSSAYTLKVSDRWVNVTGTTTIKAPHADTINEWVVFNSGSNTVTLEADSGNFNGGASVSLSANTGMIVHCDGSNCFGH